MREIIRKKIVEKVFEKRYNIKNGGIIMETLVIDRDILPEPIFSYIQSKKIRIFEENGNVILSPIKNNPNPNELFGMFNDGKLSSEDFIKQKATEMEMEN